METTKTYCACVSKWSPSIFHVLAALYFPNMRLTPNSLNFLDGDFRMANCTGVYVYRFNWSLRIYITYSFTCRDNWASSRMVQCVQHCQDWPCYSFQWNQPSWPCSCKKITRLCDNWGLSSFYSNDQVLRSNTSGCLERLRWLAYQTFNQIWSDLSPHDSVVKPSNSLPFPQR